MGSGGVALESAEKLEALRACRLAQPVAYIAVLGRGRRIPVWAIALEFAPAARSHADKIPARCASLRPAPTQCRSMRTAAERAIAVRLYSKQLISRSA